MPSYDFRILLETVEGNKLSYYSSSFVNTSVDNFRLTSTQVYHRITGSVSASYQNETIFSGSDINTSFTFKDNNLLSASLSGSEDTGSIVFTALDTEYDRLLRYKFIGEKVTNVLGLPSDQWIYVDQVRLPVDDEANVFQGNANLGNVVITDTLTFAGGSDVNSDVPFLIDTGSDRYIKFVDERGISEVALRMGYDTDRDVYEISGSDNFTFKIGGLDTLDGNITSSTFLFQENVDGGDTTIRIYNSNTDNGTDKGAGIEFKHATDAVPAMKPAGKIIAGKDSGYASAGGDAVQDSNLQFYTTLNGTDTERLRIDSNGLAIFTGDISASGDLIVEGSIQATQITSSIVSSSIIFSSGSNIFGDADDDTHTFNGHITASGNISASGDVLVDGNILNFGRLTFDTSAYIDSPSATETLINQSLKVNGNITASGNISASGDLTLPADGIINFGSDNAQIKGSTGALDLIHSQTNFESGIRLDTNGHIEFATVHNNNLDFDTDTRMMISMSGADGTVKVGIGTIVPAEHLTVEGNISASGMIFLSETGSAIQGNVPSGVGLLFVSSSGHVVFQSGSTTTVLGAGGGGSFSDFTVTADGGSNQTIEDGNTLDIAGGTNITTAVGATDTVTVNLDASPSITNLTASGNISASGYISSSGVTISEQGDLRLIGGANDIIFGEPGDTTSQNYGIKTDGNLFLDIDKDNDNTGNFFQFRSNQATTNIMRIKDTGEVGIGTTSPSNTLHVAGTMLVSGSGADGNSLFVSGGRIGIQTASPEKQIHLAGATSQLYFAGTAGGAGGGIVYKDSGGVARYSLFFPGSNVVALANRGSNGRVDIRANDSTAGSGGEKIVMSITGSERVGIRTTNPTETLDVSGSMNISGPGHITASGDISGSEDSALTVGGHGNFGYATSTNTGQVKIITRAADNSQLVLASAGNSHTMVRRPASSTGMQLIAGDTIRVNILEDGNVGIGNITPTTKLQVDGDISASGYLSTESHITASGNISASGNIIGELTGIGGAVTGITSLLATDIKIGEDDETKIDFEDANTINFYANNAKEVVLAENSLSPGTSNGTALGTTSLQWSDLFLASGGVINFNNGDITLTHSAGSQHLKLAGGNLNVAGNITASGNISSSGIITGEGLVISDDAEIADDLTVKGTLHITSSTDPNLILEDPNGSNVLRFRRTDQNKNFDISMQGNDLRIISTDDDGSQNVLIGVNSGGTPRDNRLGLGVPNPTERLSVFGNVSISGSGMGHITASGNISASGTGSFGLGIFDSSVLVGQTSHDGYGTVTANTNDLIVNGQFSAAGSAGSAIYKLQIGDTLGIPANEGDLNVGGDLKVSSHITASGNISASSGISSSDVHVTGRVHANNIFAATGTSNFTAMNIGGGFGATGVSIASDGDIQTDGTLEVKSATYTSSFKVSQADGAVNGVTQEAAEHGGGWARAYNFSTGSTHRWGGYGGFGGKGTFSYFYIGKAYNDHTMTIMSSSKKVGIGNTAPTSELTVEGDISASGNLNIQGSITATSITSSFVTSSVVLTEGSTQFGDASGDTHTFIGNITASGNISASGEIAGLSLDINGTSNFADDITIAEGKKIIFDSTDTFINANTDNPEDLQIAADEDIVMSPDDNVIIQHGSTTYATFDGDARQLTLQGTLALSHSSAGQIGSKFEAPTQAVHTLRFDSQRFRFWAGGSERLTILSASGNVGIGKDSPTETLELGAGGRIKVTPGSDATGSILSLANDQDVLLSSQNDSATGDPQQFVLKHNAGDTELINRRGDLILSASTDRVGVGTNVPTYALHVSGSELRLQKAGNDAIITSRTDGAGAYFIADSQNANYAGFQINHGGSGAWFIGGYNSADFNIVDGNRNGGFKQFVVENSTGNVSIQTGSLNLVGQAGGHITASGNYSGSANSTFRIGGKLIAGSKSFVIDRPEGGKLEYGVLEGQQNDVFFRGELKGDNVIYLPQEWEWLVDENTITVQLTSIGKHQELFVKEIKDNKIFIDINGMFKGKNDIHCYHIIHGTRKDVELIRNYQ